MHDDRTTRSLRRNIQAADPPSIGQNHPGGSDLHKAWRTRTNTSYKRPTSKCTLTGKEHAPQLFSLRAGSSKRHAVARIDRDAPSLACTKSPAADLCPIGGCDHLGFHPHASRITCCLWQTVGCDQT